MNVTRVSSDGAKCKTDREKYRYLALRAGNIYEVVIEVPPLDGVPQTHLVRYFSSIFKAGVFIDYRPDREFEMSELKWEGKE